LNQKTKWGSTSNFATKVGKRGIKPIYNSNYNFKIFYFYNLKKLYK